jgi:GT2 family glycosyltransferase
MSPAGTLGVPSISVHIVTYNSAATIAHCVNALLQQQGVDFQVRVIDNASTDATVQIVEALHVPLSVNGRNQGYARAHNHAIDSTDSDYVLTLNPDVELAPGFLQQMYRTLENRSTVGAAAGRLLRVEQLGDTPHAVDSTGLFMRRNRRQGLRHEGLPVDAAPTTPEPIFGPDGAAAFFRRTMLDDVRVLGEVFDEDFFLQKEDVDLVWRAQLRGWQALYVPDAVGYHIRSFRPGRRYRTTVSQDMRFFAVRNRYLLMIKNEIPAHFWRDVVTIGVYDLGILAYIVLREHSSWKALWGVFKLLRRMRTKRRIIQAARQASWHDVQQWFV